MAETSPSRMTGDGVTGYADPRFAPLAEQLSENVRRHGETGAALCVYHEGRAVADLVAGDYTPSTVQVTRSISKGVLSLVTLVLNQQGVLDVDTAVTRWWPEFGAAGKDGLLVRWIMSHQAGLPSIEKPLSATEGLRWVPPVEALQAQRPHWAPGQQHGYHDLSYGWLLGEVLQRASGERLSQLVARHLAAPLQLSLWCGLPVNQMRRVRPIRPAHPGGGLNSPKGRDSQSLRTVHSVARNPDFSGWEHRPEYLAATVPATNVVSDARSLARLFAAAIGKVDGLRLLNPDSLRRARTVRAQGPDLVVGWDRRYSDGFMLPDPTRPLAGLSSASFGYYGQGGSVAFADSSCELSFAYLSIQEQLRLGADPRTEVLARLARECALGHP